MPSRYACWPIDLVLKPRNLEGQPDHHGLLTTQRAAKCAPTTNTTCGARAGEGQELPSICRRPPQEPGLPVRRSRLEVPSAQRDRSLPPWRGHASASLHHATQLPLPLGSSTLEVGGVVGSAAKARQRVARKSMVSRTCPFISAPRRSYSSAGCRHCSRALDGMARSASFLVVTSGSPVASLSRRSPSRIESAIPDAAITSPLPQHRRMCRAATSRARTWEVVGAPHGAWRRQAVGSGVAQHDLPHPEACWQPR